MTRTLLLLAALTLLVWAWRRPGRRYAMRPEGHTGEDQRAFPKEEIARLFGVSPHLMGRHAPRRPLDLGPELGIDAGRRRHRMAALDSEPEWPIRDPRPDWLLAHDADWLRERLEGWL